MKRIILPILLLVQAFIGYTQNTTRPSGNIEFISDELSKLINKNAQVEIVAEGFQFTEGPVWVEKEKMLLLSDVPGNTIYKWTEAKGKEIYVKPGGYTDTAKRGGFMGPNGLLITKKGELLICQHGDRRVAKMDAPLNAPESKFITVAGEYNGKRLNSPNDIFLGASGDLYITDPSYGFERGARDPKKEIPYQGVYKMDKTGKVTLLIDSIAQPNGISIFPGGKKLLVSNSDNRKKIWYIYDITRNGTLANGKIFYDASDVKEQGICDGFKIDNKGNVFAAGPGGIWIFTKTGKLLGKIKFSGATPSNCAFTPDNKTIYITANSYLFRVKMR
jgi:gluconolactonase